MLHFFILKKCAQMSILSENKVENLEKTMHFNASLAFNSHALCRRALADLQAYIPDCAESGWLFSSAPSCWNPASDPAILCPAGTRRRPCSSCSAPLGRCWTEAGSETPLSASRPPNSWPPQTTGPPLPPLLKESITVELTVRVLSLWWPVLL